MSPYQFSQRWLQSLSYIGLVLATLFFAASLTPSLLPRHYVVQGLLSGLAVAVGYGLGVLGVELYHYLELPPVREQLRWWGHAASLLAVAPIVVLYLWRATVWQNSIRELMEMEPLETAYPIRVTLIAAVIATGLLVTARGLRRCWLMLHNRLIKFVPRRISYVLTTLVVGTVLLLLANDVFARLALKAADAVFLRIDTYRDDEIPQPIDALAAGSSSSLISWDSIGLQGKRFVADGPTAASIGEFWGSEARQPLRVYVGVRSRTSYEERAQLALEELIRVGGFQRANLVIATPTGTGWLDPGAVDTFEYLHRGDTAIVSTQYSYLPSWITILVDPQRSRHSARALFDAVYGHWAALPSDARPKLYLHGLSLGSLGSETSADLFTVFEDPIQGGLWSGPPFPSTAWNKATESRNADSPAWLPTFRDGAVLRFTGRETSLNHPRQKWSSMRFVYLQHASDPMIFFSPDMAYRRPAWLAGERGPDVSPHLRWYPVVTFLQTAFDLPMATSVPHGYGHNYDPSSYIDCWIAITDPPDWNASMTERLKQRFSTQAK